jgi:hypothetical protein
MLISLLAAALLSAGCASEPQPPLGQVVLPPLELEPLPGARPAAAPAVAGPPHAKGWEADNERPWKYIVLHHSATDGGTAESFDASHRHRGWDELGYHFVICNGNGADDGLIQVGSRWEKQKHGAHTGGTPDNEYNELGIGICLVGSFENELPSRKQLESLHKLVAWLRWKYKIPAGRVIGHRDAPETATRCPGGLLHRYIAKAFAEDGKNRLAADTSDSPEQR